MAVVQIYPSALQYDLSFFINDTATTEIYALSLHDALPISVQFRGVWGEVAPRLEQARADLADLRNRIDADRKSTRLNSSHANISYAVFCLKKKRTYLKSRYDTLPYATFHMNIIQLTHIRQS